MAIYKLSINDQPMHNVPGTQPPEDIPNKELIHPQPPDLACTPDPTKTTAHRQAVGMENSAGKRMAKHLDSATSIASTQKNAIQNIYCCPHPTFSKLNYLPSNGKPG
jgi:hypothetical protein